MKKKLFTLFSSCIFVAIMMLMSITASAEILSGSCGDTATYTYDTETFVMTVSGTGSAGRLYDFDEEFKSQVIKVVFLEGITEISYAFFENLTNLTEVIVPKTVTDFNKGSYSNCYALKSINVDKENGSYTSVNGVLFNKDVTELLVFPEGFDEKDYVLPETVTDIKDFDWYCPNIESITIPDGITKFSSLYFEGCVNLKEYKVSAEHPVLSSFDGIIFNKDMTAILAYPTGRGPEYVIPDGVTAIGKCAFINCYNLRKLTIDENVTEVDSSGVCFYYCPNLFQVYVNRNSRAEEVFLNDKDFGGRIFYIGEDNYSEGLEFTLSDNGSYYIVSGVGTCTDIVINIPEIHNGLPVKEIGNNSFAAEFGYKSKVRVIIIPEGVLKIGVSAFSNCSSLYEVQLPQSLEIIDTGAFCYCSSLKSITLPSAPVTFGGVTDYDPYDRLGLGVTLPFGLVTIGDRAFYECSKLDSGIYIPDTVTYIGRSSFSACSLIREFIVDEANENYTSVDGVLFDKEMKRLMQYPSKKPDAEYKIPETVVQIDFEAFGYNEIIDLYIPSIFIGIFYCDSFIKIQNFHVDENNKRYLDMDGVLFRKLGASALELVRYPAGKTETEYIIPENVSELSDGAFENCANLTDITFPKISFTIGNRTFADCSGLTEVILPDNLRELGSYAFSSCENLKHVELPASVSKIDYSTFNGCFALKSLKILGMGTAFENDFDSTIYIDTVYLYKNSLADKYFSEERYTKIYLDQDIEYSPESDFSYVPQDGDTAIIWRYVGNSEFVRIPETLGGYKVVALGSFAFMDSKINSITIPKSVNVISPEAFSDMSVSFIEVDEENENFCSVEGVLFSKDKTVLVRYPNMIGNESYEVPNGVTIIGAYAFEGCSQNLRLLTFPESLTTIESYAFSGASIYESINITKNIKDIQSMAFTSSAVKGFTVDEGNEYYSAVDGVLFNKNKTILIQFPGGYFGRSSYVIPDGVKEISHGAFQRCSYLKELTIPEGLELIGDFAFNYVSFENLYIPKSVKFIGSCAFSGGNIDISDENPYFCDVDGVLFTKDMKELIYYPQDKIVTEYHIPNGVTKIWSMAFNCRRDDNIGALYVPKSVKTFGDMAFGHHYQYGTVYVYKGSAADGFLKKEWGFEDIMKYLEATADPGDANGDSVIDSKDAVMLAQYLAKWSVELEIDAADCNGDGVVDSKDAVMLAQYLAKWNVTLG